MKTYHITLDRINVLEQAVRDARELAIMESGELRHSALDIKAFYDEKMKKLEDAEQVVADMKKLAEDGELIMDYAGASHVKTLECGTFVENKEAEKYKFE